MDNLIVRLERIRDRYGMLEDDYDCITLAAAEIHTAREGLTEVYLSGVHDGAAKGRAERDAALAEGVALGIEAAFAQCLETGQSERLNNAGACAMALRNLDPAAIIAARERSAYAPLGDSDGDDGA
jgi:hypothetical protein